ncbi:MAG: ribose-5-phosphate isomerase RpiA [Acidobacteriaceae bacterium]|jgi:ribose 5-phosphate isomerase A
MTQDEAKRLVAKRAAELVEDGTVVGLGTGTTATLFIRELAARKLNIRCVASSDASHELAVSLGMHVRTLAELPELDVYIDGADEVCCAAGAHAGLDLIKGGGGALLREKIVASAAREFIVVADATKLVKMLGKFPLPVEIIQMALPLVAPKLAALGFTPKLRMKKGIPQGLKPLTPSSAGRPEAKASGYLEANPEPFVTDEGNYILDCWSTGIPDPETTAAEIRSIVGVVEHGLFLGMATLALVAGEDGVREYRA